MLHAHIQEFGVQQDGWLFIGERNGGVPPTTVAEWAGHSVEVLLRIYAKCLDGGDALIRQRVQAALGHAVPTSPRTRARIGHRYPSTAGPSRTWSDTQHGR